MIGSLISLRVTRHSEYSSHPRRWAAYLLTAEAQLLEIVIHRRIQSALLWNSSELLRLAPPAAIPNATRRASHSPQGSARLGSTDRDVPHTGRVEAQ